LYPATLLKLFVVSGSFFVECFGPFMYKIMSSANRDSLTTSCLIYILFISFSCLIALARNSKTILNMNGESGHPYLIPDFRGNGFSCSLFSMMLVVGFLCMAFIMLSAFLLF
jgi:hypothetical protein